MNADTSLLLTTVLREKPCVDTTLQTTVQSVPFAVKCIAHQAYYTIYLISVVRALLNDEPSAYVYLVHRLQELQELHRDVHLGRACLVSSRFEADTVIGAEVEQTGYILDALPNVPAGAERVFYALPDIVAAMPRVVPASSLELRVTLVGSGAVGHCLLQTLLDDHPRLLHPNRITVITRQPERLTSFAARGVLCVDRKHGRQAVNQCDVLILALQGHQVQEFAKLHFAAKLPGVDLDPPARLQPGCLVFSCVAGMPTAKLASLLSHPEPLIVRPEVPVPGPVDRAAQTYEANVAASTDLLIQSMADHDSFLRSAVVEAEDIHVMHIAETIVSQDLAASAEKKQADRVAVNIPVEVARRRAVAAATAAAKAPYQIPRSGDVLLSSVQPLAPFLTHTWNAVHCCAAVQLTEARQRDHKNQGGKADKAGHADASTADAGRRPYQPRLAGGPKRTAADASVQSDGAFLCVALAALPAEMRQPLARATLLLHGAPENGSAGAGGGDTGGSAANKEKLETAPGSAGPTVSLRRRMPDRYTEAADITSDLTNRYLSILRDEA